MNQSIESLFLEPDSEFTPFPFWFWNDQLEEKEIKRQIQDFHSKGIDGFVIHPRIGLPQSLEYLSDEFMSYVQCAVEEAALLGMQVILYDEGMYPSGAANGKVVQRNPQFASKGLQQKVYRPKEAKNLTFSKEDIESIESVQYGVLLEDGQLRENSLKAIPFDETGIDPDFICDEKNGIIYVFSWIYTKGTIRGIHFGEDDGEANVPLSADLLDPEAVKTFLEITHERYYQVLKDYFGTTVIAMFTDEPSIMGRGHCTDLRPWTKGMLEYYIQQGGKETDLPFLWIQNTPKSQDIQRHFNHSIVRKLEESYYKPISQWCIDHTISMTGHPEHSEDIGLLKHFQIPAQDLVWRWVAPENNLGVTGSNSTMGKCSSDSARHRGIRRNGNECFGCCDYNGVEWSFSADDMKWYMDWLFVRGVNLLFPHAFYYSVNGVKRYGERPPDVGPNNHWWQHYKKIATYIKRMSYMMTDCVNQAQVAVLCEAQRLPWKSVELLYRNQIEFNYLEEELFTLENCSLVGNEIHIQKQCYRVLIIEEPERFEQKTLALLLKFMHQGGAVFVAKSDIYSLGSELQKQVYQESIVYVADKLPIEDIRKAINSDFVIHTKEPDLRVTHIVKDEEHFYCVTNEGEELIRSIVSVPFDGSIEKWDPWEGKITGCNHSTVDAHYSGIKNIASTKRLQFEIELPRRTTYFYKITEPIKREHNQENVTFNIPKKSLSKPMTVVQRTYSDYLNNWKVSLFDFDDNYLETVDLEELVPIHTLTGSNAISGKFIYETKFDLSESVLERESGRDKDTLLLDLGEVFETACVHLNGNEIGVKLWGPYLFDMTSFVKHGTNTLTVEVCATRANKYSDANLASGLIGPVSVYKENEERDKKHDQ